MRIVICLFVLLWSVTPANGVPAKAHKTGKGSQPVKKAQPVKIGVVKPVNPASTWFQDSPVSDFDALFKAKMVPPKDEFETTTQYQKRLDAIQASDYYAVALDDPPYRYNADRQGYEAFLNAQDLPAPLAIKSAFGSSRNEHPVIVVKRTSTSHGTYQGSNAFGVRATINKYTVAEDAVILRRPVNGGIAGIAISLFVPVPSERARSATLAFLLVFSTEERKGEGYTATDERYSSPTVDSPSDVTTHSRYIFSGDSSVWAYDKKTGDVLAKIRIGMAKPTLYPGAETTAEQWEALSRKSDVTQVTPDGLDAVEVFFRDLLTKEGLTPTVHRTPDNKTSVVTAIDPKTKRDVRILLLTKESGSGTMIAYTETGIEP